MAQQTTAANMETSPPVDFDFTDPDEMARASEDVYDDDFFMEEPSSTTTTTETIVVSLTKSQSSNNLKSNNNGKNNKRKRTVSFADEGFSYCCHSCFFK